MVMGEGFGGHGRVGLVVCGGRLFYVWCTYVRYRGACVSMFVRWCVYERVKARYYFNSKQDSI